MPFTVEQFLQVFTDYNLSIWPAQIVLWAAGAVTAILLFFHTRSMSRMAMSILAALWLWCGVVYHWMHFTRVNPAAWLFGALFIAGALFLYRAGRTTDMDDERPLRIAVGGAIAVYGLLIYPAAAYLSGHVYPEVPTFGAPGPLVIFTIGLLIAAKPPMHYAAAVVPLIWSVIAIWAPLRLGMVEDFGLLLAGIALVATAAADGIHHRHHALPASV